MSARKILAVFLLAGVLGAAVTIAMVARRIIHPVRSRPTQVRLVPGKHRIFLEATPLTMQPGNLGLLYERETRHAVLGPILNVEDRRGVERSLTLIKGSPAPRAGELARPVGNIFATAAAVDSQVREVVLKTGVGPAPAWVFGGVGKTASIWAIHVHGSLSGREGAFRSVQSIAPTGYTSLVPSIRGDGESPGAPRGSFTLGQTEWLDIEVAVEYAISEGAERVVLVGWSSGASIALQTAKRSENREIIRGLILISPVVNWRSSILLGAHNSGVPKIIALAAIRALGADKIAQLLGSPEPLRFDELDGAAGLYRLTVPTLLIHSEGDRVTPYADTERLAADNPDYVELARFNPTGHALEWNSDQDRFDNVVREWCARTQG